MTSAPHPTPLTADDDWWRSAVVYQVYVRSFADADGDGVGDLQGIRQRLPYLRDLGVDALWLTPFYTSPQVDAGYDVADYRNVDPLFGNLTDFDAMITGAHALGLRIIVDLVPNHTSSAHPWFTAALAAGPGSPERERYLFAEGRGEQGEQPPNDWESIFGGPAWTRVADGQWYLHLFDPAQPDLNWRHPEVRAEFEDILRFWLDRGVDGFRIDVAHGMIKAEGLPDVGFNSMTTGRRQSELLGKGRLPYFDQDEVHDIYRAWRPILDSYPGGRMAVAEAWAETPQRLARYIGPDELHQAFSFDFLDATWSADSFRKVIDTALAESTIVGAPTTWVLSNHDRQRHVTRYGDGEVGLRRRPADVRPARLRLRLPGRGAGPARGAGPPRRAAAGSRVPAHRREPGRLPGADPVERRAGPVRLRPGGQRAELAAGPGDLACPLGGHPGGGDRLDAGALPGRAADPARAPGAGRHRRHHLAGDRARGAGVPPLRRGRRADLRGQPQRRGGDRRRLRPAGRRQRRPHRAGRRARPAGGRGCVVRTALSRVTRH
jgi:hypothetical protein